MISSGVSLFFYLVKQLCVKDDRKRHMKFWLKVIAKSIILIVCPIPYNEYRFITLEVNGSKEAILNSQYLGDYLSAFMLLRLMFLFRVLLQH